MIQGGGEEFWADGIAGDTILEAKFVSNAASSPFIAGSNIPDNLRAKINAKIEDEFYRMSKIISDPSNPLREVEVIVNDAKANQFFIDLLRKHGLDGRVINR